MNKIIKYALSTFILIALFTSNCMAQVEVIVKETNRDTTDITVDIEKTQGHDDDEIKTVDIDIAEKEITINIGQSHKHEHNHNGVRIGMLDIGMSSYVTSDNQLDLPSEIGFLDQRLWRSVNVGIHLVNYKFDFNPDSKKHRVGLSSGLKWNIVHYSMEQDYNLIRNQPDYVSALDYEVPTLKKNRLKANHIQIPFLLEYNSSPKNNNKAISLGIGYVHQFLLQSNYKYKTEDGEKLKTKGEFNLRKSMGFVEARLGLGPLNFYLQYGLGDLFQTGAGPELTPVNFGINIIPR